ncbi:SAM-dependent methyltransferase [Jeotgalibacillus proteolyticus]|uniref:SAM-dependent methyltransferase n=1 Tax=Jeotgalibacillus proteolyticus TaxID=2082395 RepID=UPI003CF80DEF
MNHWEQRYQSKEYMYGTEPNQFLSDILPELNVRGKVLAIAEGEGRNAVFLAEKGLQVHAWDYAQAGLDKTNKLAQSKGVTVQTELKDLSDVDWVENQWDAVVCIFGHFPKETRDKTLEGILRAVKPGGYFITEVYAVEQLNYGSGGPKSEEFMYKEEDFLDGFKNWDSRHFFKGEVERYEGKLHNGLSHVIQYAGQKPYE